MLTIQEYHQNSGLGAERCNNDYISICWQNEWIKVIKILNAWEFLAQRTFTEFHQNLGNGSEIEMRDNNLLLIQVTTLMDRCAT
jgi:hypothetical protein